MGEGGDFRFTNFISRIIALQKRPQAMRSVTLPCFLYVLRTTTKKKKNKQKKKQTKTTENQAFVRHCFHSILTTKLDWLHDKFRLSQKERKS